MGMQSNPCSGYVVEGEKLKEMLPPNLRPRFEELVEDWDFEELKTFCDSIQNLPHPATFFILGDEDESDGELERGVLYAMFEEDDLFVKTKTPQMLELEKWDVAPKRHNWTIFG